MVELLTWFDRFETPEISIASLRVNELKNIEVLRVENRHKYGILSANSGLFRVFCSGNTFDLTPGDIFVTMPFENYYVVCLNSPNPKTEKPILTNVEFVSNLFENVVGDGEYLRVFNNRKKGQNCFYTTNDFDENLTPTDVLGLVKTCVRKNLGFVHLSSLISTLITVLDIAFDKKYGVSNTKSFDDYDVKIWDYILNNCLRKITAQMVEKEFSVSKWYLDKVTNKFYEMPFHKTINSIRMWHSKKLMKDDLPLSRVATLCGFDNYSSFYRGYIKFFNISPKEDYLYYKKHQIFYSDSHKKEK